MGADAEFTMRLARVKANAGRSVIMVGPDESFVHQRNVTTKVSRPREIGTTLAYPWSLAGAFLLGMIAVVLGHYVRFHLVSEGGELANPDLEMALAGGIGLMASFALSQMFRLSSNRHRALQVAGVFLMVGTFHNLGHWFPAPMSAAFSPEWVAQVQVTSPANSFRLSERYIPLVQDKWAADPASGPDAVAGTEVVPTGPAAPLAGCKTPQASVQRIVLDSEKDKTPGSRSSTAKTIAVQPDCATEPTAP